MSRKFDVWAFTQPLAWPQQLNIKLLNPTNDCHVQLGQEIVPIRGSHVLQVPAEFAMQKKRWSQKKKS